jgi:competence protein ComEC
MKTFPHQPIAARNPLLLLAISLSTGILLVHVHPLQLNFLLISGGTVSIATLIAVGITSNRMALVFMALAVFCLGGALQLIEHKSEAQSPLVKLLDSGSFAGEPVEVTGVIDGPVDVARDGIYFSLKISQIRSRDSQIPSSGTVAFIASITSDTAGAEYDQLDLHHGVRLRVVTTLRRANNFRNPGVQLRTEYLDRKGYDATAFIKTPKSIERLNEDDVFNPLMWLYVWRNRVQKQIDSRFSFQTAGVLDAALLGNRYNLTPSTSERFRAGGTFHVLVISGLHISFIGALTLMITRRVTKRKGVQFIASAIVLWGYTLAVGAEASVVRAALMFTIVALAPVIFRRASSLNALSGTVLLLLIWHPHYLFDPSFQLTMLSVLAIVAIAWPLLQKMTAVGSWQPTRETPYPPSCSRSLRSFCEMLFWSERSWQQQMQQSSFRCKLLKSPGAALLEKYYLQRPARYVLAALVVSLSVQVLLLPLLVIYFHRLSLASLLLNIGVSSIMAVEAIVAIVALVLAQFSLLAAEPLIGLANLLNWLMVHSVDPFSQVGVASTRMPAYSGRLSIINAIYYVPLVALCAAIWRWNPFALSGQRKRIFVEFLIGLQILLLLLVIFHPFSSQRPDALLHVSFLDVGQGDSALVTMPDGTKLLVDGGGSPAFFSQPSVGVEQEDTGSLRRSIGEVVVSEYLWSRGLDSVDYILATHADSDHIDGLNDVARNFKVRGALVARQPAVDPEFKKFAETLRAQRIPLVSVGSGDVLRFGNVTATVLWPPPDSSEAAPSRNNDSVVLKLQYGKRVILLTGDIEKDAEAAILNANGNLKADVVKVAHHGSRSSSIEGFVAATQPQFAIVSVGQTSIFGHPHSEVVERWRAAGAELMTTGSRGTITVTTNGDDLVVESFVQAR